ncbi:Tyrosine recombinase XerC [subsurface metagenome]
MVTKTCVTLSNLIQNFLLSRQHLRPKTLRYYRTCLGNLQWYAQKNGWPTDAGDVTRDHIRAFLAYIETERNRWGYTDISRSSSRQASPATVHHYGRVVKILFNWAEEEECLDKNPIRRLKLRSPGYKDVEPHSDEEVQAMLNVCEDEARFRHRYLGIRNKAIISLFVATGLRLTELSDITLSDLDPRLQQVRVMGKGAKMRVVPLDGEVRKSLRHYLEIRPRDGDELWKTADGLKLTARGIQMVVKHLKKRAGIKGGGGPHRFRHYFATKYLEAGGDINSLRLLLGHATLDMVLRYSRYVDVQKALANHQQFNPLDRLYRGGNHNRGDDGWGWRY